ncbi:MAG TPA: cytochrome c3 family protein [Pirellulaceae bacterium]
MSVYGQQLDPAAWGDDHIGRPLPEFTSGDECLFCHRDVGPGWPTNRHGQTIRSIDPQSPAVTALADLPGARSLAAEVELLMGGRNRQRFLKRSADHGRLDLLSVEWVPSKSGADGRLSQTQSPDWNSQTFGSRCAGCHATAVDSTRQTFAAISLDCFVCHGEVSDGHTTQGSLVLLSPKRPDSAAVITSICAQCHVRTGLSKSTKLPFPNNFVAGDNLFRDFQVDLSAAAIAELNPADRHVQENVRDVVLLGKDSVTCLTCHNVHQQSAKKHRDVAESAICANCHVSESKRVRVPYVIKSAACGY